MTSARIFDIAVAAFYHRFLSTCKNAQSKIGIVAAMFKKSTVNPYEFTQEASSCQQARLYIIEVWMTDLA